MQIKSHFLLGYIAEFVKLKLLLGVSKSFQCSHTDPANYDKIITLPFINKFMCVCRFIKSFSRHQTTTLQSPVMTTLHTRQKERLKKESPCTYRLPLRGRLSSFWSPLRLRMLDSSISLSAFSEPVATVWPCCTTSTWPR